MSINAITMTPPQEQLRILQSPFYQTELKEHLPATLVPLICSYVPENLGPNGDNWYKVLRNLKILPQNIPALPVNIRDILTSTCPIFGAPNRVTDTHTLWLIPGGRDIDRFAVECGDRKQLHLLSLLHLANLGGSDNLRTPQAIEFTESQWVLMSDILPNSMNQHMWDQNKMIATLRKKSFLNYQIPSFKYALAANLLKIRADGKGLWLKSGGRRRLTRVEETYAGVVPGKLVGPRFSLAVGSQFLNGLSQTEICGCATSLQNGETHSCDDPDVGMAAMWLNFTPKPSSSCTLS